MASKCRKIARFSTTPFSLKGGPGENFLFLVVCLQISRSAPASASDHPFWWLTTFISILKILEKLPKYTQSMVIFKRFFHGLSGSELDILLQKFLHPKRISIMGCLEFCTLFVPFPNDSMHNKLVFLHIMRTMQKVYWKPGGKRCVMILIGYALFC